MAHRDLKLNSLERYGKGRSRLLLEEHGHCEVPAGCGGVVLRWRNPTTGLLFILHALIPGRGTLLLDRVPLSSGRLLIPFGERVLACVVSELEPGPAVFALAAIHDESLFGFPRVTQPTGRKISIESAADGTWKYVTHPPSTNSWMDPGFDDSSWQPMTVIAAPSFDQQDMRVHRLQQILRLGGVCLGLETQSSRAWIRKSFIIQQES